MASKQKEKIRSEKGKKGRLNIGSISYSAPRQGLSPAQIKEIYGSQDEYDAAQVRHFASFYNRPVYYQDMYSGMGYNIPSQYATTFMGTQMPVQRILRNYRYYNGDQINFNFAFLPETVDHETIPAPYIPGQKAFQIVEFLKSTYANYINNAKLSVRSTSNEAAGAREERYVLAMMRYKFGKLLDDIERDTGVSINSIPEDRMGSEESIKKYINETPFESSEKLCQSLLNRIVKDNNIENSATRSHLDCRIGGYTGAVVRVVNGRVEIRFIRPDRLIVDNREDDDHNSYARFGGIIEFMTPEEIYTRWDFDEDDRKELYSMAGGTSENIALLNGPQGTLNYSMIDTQNRLIAVVSMFWLQATDTRYAYKKNANGEVRKPFEYRVLKDEDPSTGDFIADIPRQAVLIGNRFIRDNKFCDNVVYHPSDKKRPLIPLLICTPNMVSGICRSAMDRIVANQDMHDAVSWKIRDRISKLNGKMPVIDGSQLENQDALDLESDFKKMGFAVVNLSSPDPGDPTERRPLIQYADFTSDSDVKMFIEIKKEEERLMNEMYNTVPTVTGTNTTYMGFNSQQSAITQATMGISNDVYTHVQFISNVLQLAVNTAKNFYSSPEGAEVAKDILSEKELTLLKLSKALRWEDMSAIIDITDTYSDSERMEMLKAAQTIIPTGNIEALEAIMEIQSQPTKTGVRAEIKRLANEYRRRMNQEQMLKTATEAALKDAQGRTTLDAAALKAGADIYAADAAADSRVEAASARPSKE